MVDGQFGGGRGMRIQLENQLRFTKVPLKGTFFIE